MVKTDLPGLHPHFVGTDGSNILLFVPAMIEDFDQLTGLIEYSKKYFAEQGLEVNNVSVQPTHSNQLRMQRLTLTVGLGFIGGAELLRPEVKSFTEEFHGRYASRCAVKLNEVFGPDGRHRYTEAYLEVVDQGLLHDTWQETEANEGVVLEFTEQDETNKRSVIRCQLHPRTSEERYGGIHYQPHEVVGRVAEGLGIYIDGRVAPHQQQFTALTNTAC